MTGTTYVLTVVGFVICVIGFLAVLVALISRTVRGTLFEDEIDTGEWEPIADILEPEHAPEQREIVVRADPFIESTPGVRRAAAKLTLSLVRNESGVLENWHKPQRGWMGTITGRDFYPLDPNADDVELVDVAHGLAFTCRYGGHTKRYYSVAEHCVLVSEVVERDARKAGMPPDFVKALALEALLHDSAEAYIGDMVRPLKHQPQMAEFRRAEERIEECVRERFGIVSTEHSRKVIKIIDDRILVDEITALITGPERYLQTDTLRDVEPIGVMITGWSPELAQHRFIERYRELTS